ncbi:hypothetical protein MHT86_08490 [Corynebacterium mastitidis]|uniref:hypothetical protein n=1 Tax=Corynebacterium mastitidis TaxID=161890 RepID=UPI001F144A81|nr:hypothetical protein [Corynebacterium mastitidis]MCH6197532.1 hypothetical protein [Corynebacterium mastitidis]
MIESSYYTPVYYDHGETPRRSPGVGEGPSSAWDALGARVMDRGQGELPGRAPEEPPATRWEAPEIPARSEPQVGPAEPWQAGYAEDKAEFDEIGRRIYEP